MDKKEATKEIAKLVEQAHEALKKAMTLADEHDVEFQFGVAYGMGGYYLPKKLAEQQRREYYNDSTELDEGDYGWQASSQSC